MAAPAKKADLKVSALRVAAATVAPGAVLSVNDTVKNAGAGKARSTRLSYLISLDGIRSADDLGAGGHAVRALGKGRSATKPKGVATVPAAAPAGVYTLLACADATARVKESNEKNNCRASATRVTVAVPAVTGSTTGPATGAPAADTGPATGGATGGSADPGTGGGPAPTPTPAPPSDRDADGTPDAQDCAPDDAATRPGAADAPDLDFADRNCDGIDGDAAGAIFVATTGADGDPGTMAEPKRTITAALSAAAVNGKDVYVGTGVYEGAIAPISGQAVFGGYDATWARTREQWTSVSGSPQALLLDGQTAVQIQLIQLVGSAPVAPGASAYGVRAINGSSLMLEGVNVSAGEGRAGAAGAQGSGGGLGPAGNPGIGSNPGNPIGGPAGGRGGFGGSGSGSGTQGFAGQTVGAAPGAAGTAGPGGSCSGVMGGNGGNGGNGQPGASGSPGQAGAGGTAATTYVGRPGGDGTDGMPGAGGGGGGGGGGGFSGGFCESIVGGGGGAGGGAGGGGGRGRGGAGGGGSFAVWLHESSATIASSTLASSTGGSGGNGGAGGGGGFGGQGGNGAVLNNNAGDGGRGGNGGNGGNGGSGAGGAGGPSVGIATVGESTVTQTFTTIARGGGGARGNGGPGAPMGAFGASADQIDY